MSRKPERSWRPRLAGALVVVACIAVVVAAIRPLRAVHYELDAKGPPLYFPSSRYLKVLSFGHDTTVADMLHLWGIQFFGVEGPEGERRRKWQFQVYDTITDLDPHFRDAYWLGFVTLLDEGNSTEEAFALAQKAMDNEPGFLLIAVEAAFTAHRLGDAEKTQHFLELAATRGGSRDAERFAVVLRGARTVQEEREQWKDLLDSDDEFNRNVARSRVRDLTVIINSERLQRLVECFEQRHGVRIGSFEPLVTAGWLAEIPNDPEGEPYLLERDEAAKQVTVRSRTPFSKKRPSRAAFGVDLRGLGHGCSVPLTGRGS